MEITINIDGRPVRFRKTGGTMLAYKREFGRDFFADLSKILEFRSSAKSAKREMDADGEASTEHLANVLGALDMEVCYNILYIMAKSADPSIHDQLMWLDSFDEFYVFDVFGQIMPMLTKEMGVDPKNVSTAAGKPRES